MTKIKTYWDEIKNHPSRFSGGKQGWEVIRERCPYSNKMIFIFPFSSGDGVSREEKALCRKDVKKQFELIKTLAQASRNREEYRDLYNRVSDENWNEIVATGLKGFDLGKYISERYLTQDQAYTLFYRM